MSLTSVFRWLDDLQVRMAELRMRRAVLREEQLLAKYGGAATACQRC